MSSTTLTLMSNDKREFTIEKEIAIQSNTIKNMVDEDCVVSVIPLANVDSENLTLVIEFLKQAATVTEKKELKTFAKDHDISALKRLLNAANYLDIKELLDVVCEDFADRIKEMSVKDVREIFKITNDFTPEEEKAVRDENAWAFETI